MADKRDILIRLLGEETVSRMAGKAGDGLDKFGDSLDAAEKDAKDLDQQIAEVEGSLKTLAVLFARTGDAAERMDISKAMRKQQTELRKLTKAKDLLPDFSKVGEEAATGFAASFVARVGPMIASRVPAAAMNPAVAAIGAPLAIGVASLLATATAGAIVGAAGIGGVAGGLMLAAKDAKVKAAGTALGADLSAMLGRASAAFVPETLDAIDTIRDRALKLEPAFTRAFNSASELLDPLLDGLLDGAENAMPGLTKAIEAAGPVIDALADGARDLGSAVGDSLGDMAEYADEGARALHVLFKVMEWGVQATTATVVAFAELYGAAEKVGALITGDLPTFYSLITAQDGAGESSVNLSGGLDGVGHAAGIAAGKAVELVDALQVLNGLQLNVNEAERGFQKAIDDAREAFNGKTRDFKGGSEKGREYGAALDNIAKKARDSAQAIFDQSGDVEKASAKINEGRIALYKQARQYGRTEAEAWAYVDSVLAIPKEWTTKVKADTGAATAAVTSLQKKITNLKGKTVYVTVRVTSKGDHYIPGVGTQLKGASRGGMITGAGPKGVDSEPRLMAPGEGVLTADEVDAVGGPAGFERLRAAIRGGGRAAPAAPAMAGGGSVATGAAPQLVRIGSDGSRMGDLLMEILRKSIGDRGGNVQFVLGR